MALPWIDHDELDVNPHVVKFDDEGNPVLTPAQQRVLDAVSLTDWKSMRELAIPYNGGTNQILVALTDAELVIRKRDPRSKNTGPTAPFVYRRIGVGETVPLFPPPAGADMSLLARVFGGYTFNNPEKILWPA